MKKYMLTIQHDEQKVAYIEFTSETTEQAKLQGENIFNNYKHNLHFIPRMPYISGNFSGTKPRILNHHISEWVKSDTATNAWGDFCGGYWMDIS